MTDQPLEQLLDRIMARVAPEIPDNEEGAVDAEERIRAAIAQGLVDTPPEVVTAVAGGPPPCPEHRERQHRDGLAPWCPRCGWNHGQAAVPPRKLGNPRNR